MSKIPYIGFSGDTLSKQPEAKPGDRIPCPNCGGTHPLEPADDGSTTVLFYRCADKLYLGALGGRVVVNVKADFSG